MEQPVIFRHDQYELMCSAKPLDGGRFAPTLVITKHVWPTRPREIAIERGGFATAQEAIDAARVRGIEWVLHYG
jgi:hypothetical protein